jgi:hypothetical protein
LLYNGWFVLLKLAQAGPREDKDRESRKPIRRLIVKISIAATFFVALRLLVKRPRLKTYGCVLVASLAGCATTQLRWDAIGMRQQVIKYYNDEIMENLIRADEELPFVHVDITGLTTIDTSQISGTIGAGETPSFTRTSPSSMVGALHTISRAVTRPFSYSVAPQRGNSLQISAAPVLGPLPAESQTANSTPTELVTTKITEFREPPEGPVKQKTTEKTLKPPEKTKVTSIYKLYEDFVHDNKDRAFRSNNGLFPPPKEAYVPGTLKRWGTRYYYINNDYESKKRYYNFCKKLFTKGQVQPLAKELQTTETAIEGVRGLQAIPPPPPPPP